MVWVVHRFAVESEEERLTVAKREEVVVEDPTILRERIRRGLAAVDGQVMVARQVVDRDG